MTFVNVPQELGILTCGKDAASEDSRLREIPSGRFLAGSGMASSGKRAQFRSGD